MPETNNPVAVITLPDGNKFEFFAAPDETEAEALADLENIAKEFGIDLKQVGMG